MTRPPRARDAIVEGTRLDLDVYGLSLEGEGLAKHEGRTVHVLGAFPGDRVRAPIVAVSKHHERLHAARGLVVEPSPDRRPVLCSNDDAASGRCTGCPLSTLELEAQRHAKVAMLARDFGIEVDMIEGGAEWGYRYAAKRIAFPTYTGFSLGSYVRGTHVTASMRYCAVDHPRIAEAARAIEVAARELRVEAATEPPKEGSVAAVWLKTDGERVLVTLVVHGHDARLEQFAARLPVHGVVSVQASKASNSLRGSGARTLAGADTLEVHLGAVKVVVGAQGFLQPNPIVAAQAYADLVETLDGTPRTGTLAFDLYAGSGGTTRLLRERFAEVQCCESHEESAAALGVPASTAEAFLEARVAAGARPELVVANPPRAGLGEAVCRALATLAPRAITLMSCHPGSLARDLTRLEAAGYARVGARAYDTLPQTPHVEVVVWLERRP